MMSQTITNLAVAFALASTVGCAYERHRDSSLRGTGSVSSGPVESAWLAGEMETVGRFDGDAYQVDGSGSGRRLTIHAGRGSFGWVMIRLGTSDADGFSGDRFRPGAHLDSAAGVVYATGCSGPSHGDWDYDGPADRVVVDVEEGPEPGSRLFHFRADYSDGQHTEGGFVVNPR